MQITRLSPFTGKENTREIPITPGQLDQYMEGNDCIQIVFPHLSPDDREFIKTGLTSEDWETLGSE